MKRRQGFILLALLVATPVTVSTANVVIDWDATAVGIVQTGTAPPPPLGFRTGDQFPTGMALPATNVPERRSLFHTWSHVFPGVNEVV